MALIVKKVGFFLLLLSLLGKRFRSVTCCYFKINNKRVFGVDLGLLIVESSYESYACKRWNRAFQMMIGILFWNASSFSHEEVCQCEHGVK